MNHFSPFAKLPSNARIRNQGAVSEVMLYGDIIESEEFVDEFRRIDSSDINVHINSRGGDVFQGVAIAAAIRRHKANVTVFVDGLAASISALIALSGNKLVMAKNTWFMIHDPWSIVIGGADDLRKSAELLDEIGDDLAATISEKSGIEKDQVVELMSKETWLNSEKAKDLGIADEIEGESEIEDKFDLSVFNNVPKELRSDYKPSPRSLEAALRDAGCSKKDAKAILAKGVSALRDVEPERRDDVNEIAARYLGVFKP